MRQSTRVNADGSKTITVTEGVLVFERTVQAGPDFSRRLGLEKNALRAFALQCIGGAL